MSLCSVMFKFLRIFLVTYFSDISDRESEEAKQQMGTIIGLEDLGVTFLPETQR